MDKIDARKLPSSAIEEKRRQTVKLRKKGMTRAQIGEIVGVHADTVGRWLKAYKAQGAKALKLKTRGRREGCGRRLDEDQERRIQKLLLNKTPDQLKMPYALWMRESVRELVKDQLGITLPIRTVGHYLKRWGMTPQKPAKQAYEQQPARVRKWLDEEYPDIQAKAKEETAEIYWGDETGLRNDCQHDMNAACRCRALRTLVQQTRINPPHFADGRLSPGERQVCKSRREFTNANQIVASPKPCDRAAEVTLETGTPTGMKSTNPVPHPDVQRCSTPPVWH